MRRIKNGLRNEGGQPGRRRARTDGRIRGGAFRRFGALVVLGLICMPLSARPPAGDREEGSAAGKAKAPLLLVARTEVDLGDLPKGSSANARFELRNAGNADLHVLDVRTGCSCTVATYDEVIGPGEVGHLTATLLTETLNGRVGQGVTVMTDDPTSPATLLFIRAQIVTAVRILPQKQAVLYGLDDESPIRRVVRRAVDSGHGFFNIVGLKTSAPWLVARAKKVREAAPATGELPAVSPGDWILELRLEGEAPYGKRREVVEFKTGLERQPLVKLEVHTNRRSPVQLPVERLDLQAGDGGAAEMLSFTVRGGLDPAALRVEASPEGLTVQLEPGRGPGRTAHVRWSGGKLDDGVLRFRIEGEHFELPVRFEPPR